MESLIAQETFDHFLEQSLFSSYVRHIRTQYIEGYFLNEVLR